MMVLVIFDKELMMEVTLTICFSNLMKVIHVQLELIYAYLPDKRRVV